MTPPLSILILGGTGFIGPHQVRYATARGHRVTLFHRPRTSVAAPSSAVEELAGDRETNDYRSLQGRRFDVCIDNPASVPHWIRDAAAALGGNVGHYIYVSTISIYDGETSAGADESAPRAGYTGSDAMERTIAELRANMALYGPLKAVCEDEVTKQFGDFATIVRPGLIAGPGDPTDRFTYWPVRFTRGGKILVPPLADPVQFIDVRDLAEWTIRLAEERCFGTFNAIGPGHALSFGAMLDAIRVVTASGAEPCEASASFLEQNHVAPWSDLPVWVPGTGQTAGFHRRSNARALQAGLAFRPLAVTIADTLAWWEQQAASRTTVLRTGLGAEREAQLIAALQS